MEKIAKNEKTFFVSLSYNEITLQYGKLEKFHLLDKE